MSNEGGYYKPVTKGLRSPKDESASRSLGENKLFLFPYFWLSQCILLNLMDMGANLLGAYE